MSLFDQVNEDMKAAMRAKDKVALAAIRNMKKLFLEAKTAPGSNDELSDEAAQKIVQKLVKQGKDAAAVFIEQDRQDLADDELAQVEVLSRYMPKQLTAEELDAAVREIVASVGAEGPKDMGKVMGAASKQLAGKAEGRAISEKVKEVLASL